MIDLSQTGLFFHRATDRPLTQFQVLGERASGTNVVRKTIEKNLGIKRIDALGWKHGFPHMVCVPDNVLVVVVVRNAVSWALSMHKRPWHATPAMQALPFEAFLRAEWQTIVDRTGDFEFLRPELGARGAVLQHDRHPMTGAPFANLFAMRTAKLLALEGLVARGCSVAFVRLETFNEMGEEFLDAFCAGTGTARTSTEFLTVHRRMGNRWKSSYDGDRVTPAEMPARDLEFLRSQLDLGQETRFGYQY